MEQRDAVPVIGFKALILQFGGQWFQRINLEQPEHPLVQHQLLAELEVRCPA